MTQGLAVGSALFVLSCVALSSAQAADKCQAADNDPAPGRIVQWTGPCSNGLATGSGIAEISANGTVVRRTEGVFTKGVATGPYKITDFESGKPVQVIEGSDDGPVKITRYKNDTISMVTEFAKHRGVPDEEKKITFYRDGAVASIETGLWVGGKLSGSCSVERYKDGQLAKAYSGICLGGILSGQAKVHIYGSSPAHDVLFEGPYTNGLLDGQGESSEVLTGASPVPAESCLKAGDVTLHYAGDWTANSMNGTGTIESDFCAANKEGPIQRVHMTAAGGWIQGDQNGETLVTYAIDGGAPIRIKRVYDHGALVSETLLDQAGAEQAKDSDVKTESLCKATPWVCSGNMTKSAPFAAHP
ncbi:MAG TPA: hypothetical protein VKP60_20705 [Magnetospirillaceae bacterium]|nr:hypothetical protein [Magnetospirillaceae bacterium]